MWEVGKIRRDRIWGRNSVEQVVKLDKPVEHYHEKVGDYYFDPAIMKIKWTEHPDFDEEQIMFPYWSSRDNQEWHPGTRGFVAMDTPVFLELLTKAISQDFFSENFLRQLGEAVKDKLEK